MVRESIQYYCSVCNRRYSTKAEASVCEQKNPYPLGFAIGDQCVIILSDGHKDNAYVCEITGMELKGHIYIRLLKIIEQCSFPYKSDYRLSEDDIRMYGAH